MYSKNELKVVNYFYLLFGDSLTIVNNWGFYLFNNEFDSEVELRNKLGVIYISSLFDLLENSESQFIEHRKLAESLKLIHIERYCRQFKEFRACVIEILEQFSKCEQVAVVYLRNQYVHGFLSSRHAHNITIKYVSNGIFKREKLPSADFISLTNDFFELGDLDDVLRKIMIRFFCQEQRYWKVIHELRLNKSIMYDAILNGREMQFKNLIA